MISIKHLNKIGSISDIDVFTTSFSNYQTHYQGFLALLSKDEKKRAKEFAFEDHRKKYIIGRALLRVLLSNYLDQTPENLKLYYNAHGKPFVKNGIEFNVSHSDDYIIFAISQYSVGIDIELMKPILDADSIIKRQFSSIEIDNYNSLSPSKRLSFFF